MNNGKMGQFISELRKTRQLTQRELAEKLNVSDKAVSKWERGLSCPDISLLSPLSNILGVTTTELLNGERTDPDEMNVDTVVVNALEYGEKAEKQKKEGNRNIIAAAFSIFLLVGIFVVSVVDLAISQTFTWSLIPITAIIFAWIIFVPSIRSGAKGIFWSLIALSVCIVPFLYVLGYAINKSLETNTMLFSYGVRVAPLSVAYIWLSYFLLKKLRVRKLLAVAILVLVASPVSHFTNVMASGLLGQPYEGVTVILNTLTPVIVAAILFIIEFALRKKHSTKL